MKELISRLEQFWVQVAIGFLVWKALFGFIIILFLFWPIFLFTFLALCPTCEFCLMCGG